VGAPAELRIDRAAGPRRRREFSNGSICQLRFSFETGLIRRDVASSLRPITGLMQRSKQSSRLSGAVGMRVTSHPPHKIRTCSFPAYGSHLGYLRQLCAAESTSTEIIERLNKAINAALADPKMKARLVDLGQESLTKLAYRVRQLHRPINREMGQGDPGNQHQAGLTRQSPSNIP
jgi:hypothetical protein